MRYLHAVSLVLLSFIVYNEGLRILVCFPVPSKSHSILGHGVVNRLLEAGHEVVHITSFPKEKPVPNLTELDVSIIGVEFFQDAEKKGSLKLKNLIGQSNFGDSWLFTHFTFTTHRDFLKQPDVKAMFSDPNEKFDAVVLEWFFSEINVGVPALFQAPAIWLCSTEPHWQALRVMDHVPNPAYTVDLFSETKVPLNFLERANELWKLVKKYTVLELFIAPFEAWTYNKIYVEIAEKRGVTMPSYTDAKYNGSLMFVNSHPSVGGSTKLPHNVINVAGYHIDEEVKPLPTNLQKLMDDAKDGVIYFSLGTNIKSDGMSDAMKSSLLKMFSKLNQTVIWKFESDLMNVPSNVQLLKWAPQPSILNHPNLKIFITHGGRLSTTEAIHFGVPVVGIPIMADQIINMRTVVSREFGIKVKLAEDMADDIENAIRKILADDTYAHKAKELSSIFHNRPMKPGIAIPYWVEYVVQTRGAEHLRSPALQLSLYQRLYIDLLALIILLVYVIIKATKLLLRKILKYFRVNKQKQN